MALKLQEARPQEIRPSATVPKENRLGLTRGRWKRFGYNSLVYLGVLFFMAWTLIPLLWLIGTAFKLPRDYTADPPQIIPSEISFDGFTNAFGNFNAGNYLLNSILITAGSTVLAIVIGLLASYSFSRFKFRGSRAASLGLLALRMFPVVVLAIPLFIILKTLGLLNTLVGIILAMQLIQLPYVVWMMKGFFDDLPIELEEAGQVDGCTRLGAFRRIVLPLMAPGIVATSTFAAVLAWNEFFLPLLLTQTDKTQPVPLLVASFVDPAKGTLWAEISAVSVVSILPVLAFSLMMQRFLVRGLTGGAVKG
ncbi:MAG: carbohydrate ABC transporter permease [Chloroflexi bacterium]|nr:carbohydrate ABC transporter permease [Chloroflexota bacterium]